MVSLLTAIKVELNVVRQSLVVCKFRLYLVLIILELRLLSWIDIDKYAGAKHPIFDHDCRAGYLYFLSPACLPKRLLPRAGQVGYVSCSDVVCLPGVSQLVLSAAVSPGASNDKFMV